MSDDNKTTTSPLDLVRGPAQTWTSTVQVGSVTYVPAGYVEPNTDDLPPNPDMKRPQLPHQDVLYVEARQDMTDPVRYSDATMAEPNSNLSGMAAQGLADENTVIVIDLAEGDETNEV